MTAPYDVDRARSRVDDVASGERYADAEMYCDHMAAALDEIDRLRAEVEILAAHARDNETEPDAEALASPHRCDCCTVVIEPGNSAVMFVDEDGRKCWAHYGACPVERLGIRTIISRRLSAPCEVEAHVLGVWGAHPDPAGPTRAPYEPWLVTHLPTGQHALVTPLRREDAIAIVARLGLMRPMGPRDLDVVIVAAEVLGG